jgi:tRNA splicing ligase
MGNTNIRVGGNFSNDGNFSVEGDINDSSNRVGGDMIGNAIGDNNQVQVSLQPADLPAAKDVDISRVLAEIKSILEKVPSEDSKKIANALEEAEDELKKDSPDKDEVGKALGRALDYAQKAEGFANSIDKLRPHVEAAAGWLGKNWHKILSVVGLAASAL